MESVCRSCMSEKTENMHSIFQNINTDTTGENVQLATMLMACASVLVENGDGLPSMLCANCEQQLSNAYRFKQQCEKSDHLLRECNVAFFNTFWLKPVSVESSMNIVVNPDIPSEILNPCPQNFDVKLKNETGSNAEHACMHCGKVYVTNQGLQFHMKRHTGSDLVSCLICGKTFTRISHLRRHMLTHSMEERAAVKDELPESVKKKYLSCKFCRRSFKHKTSFTQHIQVEHGVVSDDSDTPLINFVNRNWDLELDNLDVPDLEQEEELTNPASMDSLKESLTNDIVENVVQLLQSQTQTQTAVTETSDNNQIVSSSSPGKYICNSCDKLCESSSELEAHAHSCPQKKRQFVCQYCGNEYRLPQSLRKHQAIHHLLDEGKMHKCGECDKEFRSNDYLVRHRHIHEGKRYVCEQCGKSFSDRSAFNRHNKAIHSDSKPFVCNHCGKSFVIARYLKQHERVHTGEKPYKCRYCEKSFGFSATLRTHEIIHSGVKSYMCKFCGNTFFTPSELRIHERVHTGEKPYKCRRCEKSFRQSSDARKHERMVHGVEKGS